MSLWPTKYFNFTAFTTTLFTSNIKCIKHRLYQHVCKTRQFYLYNLFLSLLSSPFSFYYLLLRSHWSRFSPL